jgi:hypothetical protein
VTVVLKPFGFTAPLSVADVVLTSDAAAVVTDGALAANKVVKVWSAPGVVPALFVATTR